jgi:HEPN domain-containing protein
MNDLVREWVEKAEGDYRTAERESIVTEGPNWDAVCFHAQQAVEKYVKALLQQEGTPIPRSHDLPALATALLTDHAGWASEAASLARLSVFAVELRYPGEAATKKDAQEAVRIMQEWRKRLRSALGIGTGDNDHERADCHGR